MTRTALHLVGIIVITAIARPAEHSQSEDLIVRMSATYEHMRQSLIMSARVVKKVQSGDRWKESARNYHVVVSGDDFQVGLVGDSNSFITRTLRAGRVMLHSSIHNRFSDHSKNDPEALDTLQVLMQHRITFFDRFVHLAQARPIIASSRRVRLRVAKGQKDCMRVGIRAPETSEVKWTGAIWIEHETGLVWRAQMSALDDLKQQVDEDVSWTEIRSGPAAIPSESAWLAPADATRIDKWPYRLPH